jgi:aldose 1-epimerase
MSVISCQQRIFGALETGQNVTCYSLRNASGMLISVLDYGATLNAVQIPDSKGKMQEILSGFTQLEEVLPTDFYSGAFVLHYPDTLKNSLQLPSIHHKVWQTENDIQTDAASVCFSTTVTSDAAPSLHTLHLKVHYTLTATNELIIHSQLLQDSPVPIQLIHYPYWNLSGIPKNNVFSHVLQIWADHYFPKLIGDAQDQPQMPVKGTPFDFLQPQRLGERFTQIMATEDHQASFLLNKESHTALSLATRMKEPISGRTLEVYTTQTGLKLCVKTAIHSQTESELSPTADQTSVTAAAFCLSPWEVELVPTATGTGTFCYKSETRYKLIW